MIRCPNIYETIIVNLSPFIYLSVLFNALYCLGPSMLPLKEITLKGAKQGEVCIQVISNKFFYNVTLCTCRLILVGN